MTSDVVITKDPDLGLWECRLTIELPTITVTRHQKDKSDFRYEMARDVTDVVEQIVEGLIEDECGWHSDQSWRGGLLTCSPILV